jgi:thiosulfate/3-mercaptopyruvate sulfurtransferase
VRAPATVALILASLMVSCYTRSHPPDSEPYASSAGWIVSGPEAAELHAAGALFLDARDYALYEAEHLEGARHVTWQEFSAEAPSQGSLLSDDEALTEALQVHGVRSETPVVVVGQPLGGWGEGGRIVWMLRTLGHPTAVLVNGGMHSLAEAGLPVTAEPTPPPARGDFVVARTSEYDIDRDTLAALWLPERPAGVVLVDTREQREFDGATPYGESRGGHVPGAVHLHWAELVNSFGYLFGRDELLARLAERNITPDRTVVTYCTGGVRSGWLVVVLADLGFPDVRNYAGSMWEWSAGDPNDYPLVR